MPAIGFVREYRNFILLIDGQERFEYACSDVSRAWPTSADDYV